MITLRVPTLKDFWRWLALFAYRRWAPSDNAADGGTPVGIPGQRDPEAPCEAYAPRRFRAGDFTNCQTDGHYLCRGYGRQPPCAHIDPAVLEAAE